MRFLTPLIICLLASGCASAPGNFATQTSTPQTLNISGTGNVSLTFIGDAQGRGFTLDAPIDKVWAALPGVFRALEVEAGMVNERGRIFGNPNLRIRGRLAGARPSQYVDCGTNPIGVPLATNEPLQLSILTGLAPASDRATRLEVKVQGTATTGTSSSKANCGSTGKLEKRIHELLLAQFSG